MWGKNLTVSSCLELDNLQMQFLDALLYKSVLGLSFIPEEIYLLIFEYVLPLGP